MPRSAPRHAGGSGSVGALAFLVLGVAAAVVYSLSLSPTITAGAFAVVGLGTVAALVVGPSWQHAQPRRPWTLLAAACALFLIGALTRSWAAHHAGFAAFAADAFTLPGYVLVIIGLVQLLRARGSIERHAVIDGLIVWVGTAIVTLLWLALPAAEVPHRNLELSVTAGLYPLIDTVLVLLLANLAFTTAVRRPSYLLLVGTMTLLLTGDLAYAIIGVKGRLVGPEPLMDLPFLLGFTLVGAAALHPSVVDLGRAAVLPPQAWSWKRLLLIGPAVAVPFVLTATLRDRGATDNIVLGVGGLTIVVLLLFRAVSAVHSYASAQHRYQHQATHDQLTGLPNRTMLISRLEDLLRTPGPRNRPVWVYFLDLDGFKLVNDSWGHSVGDQLIAEIGARLCRVVPASAMVARVGGDEFVIAFRGPRAQAVTLAEQVLDCFAEPVRMRAAEVAVSTSVGIAVAGPDTIAASTAHSLMRDADTAMYQAKAEGRGRWTLFDSSMHDRVRDRYLIENDLRNAQGQGELRLVYQPIVDLPTGRVVGAEALSRWDHPVRGPVPPDEFIPIAEDTGIISRIGRWVMDESLAQLADWRRTGVVSETFWMSINVSPRQLRDITLADDLATLLLQYGVPATTVVLEMTESVMIDGSAATGQVLHDLRKLGVRIVVDDFGTGYSALGYLRRHPVTGVKIDRAFVRGLGTNPEDEEIVRAVAAMSTALKLTMVAEGVETPQQRQVLEGLGVALGQGRLWGAPVSPDEFRGAHGAGSATSVSASSYPTGAGAVPGAGGSYIQ
jgi:diguanylate cyclase (GGDEF)-like protein